MPGMAPRLSSRRLWLRGRCWPVAIGLVEEVELLGLVDVGVVLGLGNDELAQATVGSEDAMKAGEMEPGWGHDGGEPGNQVHGVEQDGLCTVWACTQRRKALSKRCTKVTVPECACATEGRPRARLARCR